MASGRGLTLLAGPANAGKVALLLERYLGALDRDPILIVPHGYHTTCSAPGYMNYFLWMLAGEHRTQAVAFDPNHAWIQKTIGLLKGR